jgi:hypothetical protein
MCKTKGRGQRSSDQTGESNANFAEHNPMPGDGDEYHSLFWITSPSEINHLEKSASLVDIEVNGIQLKMQLDTGAGISIISSKMWKNMGCPMLKQTNERIESYDGHQMPYEGESWRHRSDGDTSIAKRSLE